eukprot:11053417-Alexandrium_andersonii.AAC.1
MRNYVSDVRAFSGRLMWLSLKGPAQVTLMPVHAPTAEADEADKEASYGVFAQETRKVSRRGIAIVGGGFDARVEQKRSDEE